MCVCARIPPCGRQRQRFLKARKTLFKPHQKRMSPACVHASPIQAPAPALFELQCFKPSEKKGLNKLIVMIDCACARFPSLSVCARTSPIWAPAPALFELKEKPFQSPPFQIFCAFSCVCVCAGVPPCGRQRQLFLKARKTFFKPSPEKNESCVCARNRLNVCAPPPPHGQKGALREGGRNSVFARHCKRVCSRKSLRARSRRVLTRSGALDVLIVFGPCRRRKSCAHSFTMLGRALAFCPSWARALMH